MTGTELRNRRHQLNLTQSTMAERLGLSKRTIRRYELLEEVPKWLQIIMRHYSEGTGNQ
jgi:transcriptional regulator with XRE-family HTH domain